MKPDQKVSFRTSKISKGKPIAPAGQTYLHIKVEPNNPAANGYIQGDRLISHSFDKVIQAEIARIMYEEVKTKYKI